MAAMMRTLAGMWMMAARGGLLAAALALAAPGAAQDMAERLEDFSESTGVIVVTGEREGRDLFEPVPVPPQSCLAGAPPLGAARPGFTIDASRYRRVRDLEKLRRETPAGTIFVSGGGFANTRLAGAKLHDMCFFGTDWSGSDWTGFAGSGLGFVGANLSGARLAGARLPFVLLRDANLADADARRADLRNGRLDGGWSGSVRNLLLDGANLTGFRLACGSGAADGCPTDRAGLSLAGANLRRASLYQFALPQLDLAGATIDQTELSLDQLGQLAGARLTGPVVVRSPRRATMLFPSEARRLQELAAAPGADASGCAAARTPAGVAVCALPGSAVRDLLEEVGALEARAPGGRVADAARARWLAGRDGCMDLAEDARGPCLLAAYEERRRALRAAAGAPAWLRASGYRLYLSEEVALPGDGTEPVFGRLLPILLDNAGSAVILKVDIRGAVAARGLSEGGCSFAAEGLRYRVADGALALPQRRGPGAALLAVGGEVAEVREDGLRAAGGRCPGDAAFARMRHVPADAELLRDLYASF